MNVALTAEAIARARVLVVGDVMLDRYWFGDAHRISPEAPVPVVRVVRQEDRLGGAANVARNVRVLGAGVGLLSVIGTDEPGDRVEALIAQAGIGSHLHRDSGLPTTIKLRVIGRQQQLLRVDFEDLPSSEVLLDKFEQFQALLPAYDIVLMSDYAKGGLTHIKQMIDAARAASRAVLIDPKGDDFARYRGATMLTPNRAELQSVVGRWEDERDLERRVADLRSALALDAVLLTRSEEGMSLFDSNGRFDVAAQAREVFDVTGAGDTVIGTLGVMLAAGLPVREAILVANRAAGIVVGKLGTSAVTYAELFGTKESA